MALFDDLIAYWKLDESSGNPKDYGPLSADGTITGTVTHATGKNGNGLTFAAGAGNYVNIPDQAGIRIWRASTINFWVYVDSYTNGCVITKMGVYGAGFRTESAGPSFLITEGAANKADLATWVTVDSWHMVTLVTSAPNPPTMTAYVDGVQRGAINNTGHFWLGESQPIRFGAPTSAFFDSGTAASDVRLDEVAIWNRSLSAGEITTLYNSGTGTFVPSAQIEIDEPPQRRVYQRSPDATTGPVALTGTYTTAAPVTIEVKVRKMSDSSTVLDWTPLTGTSIAGGTFSGTLPGVPQTASSWQSFEARGKDVGGTVIANGTPTLWKSGVGIIGGIIGQSNGYKLFDPLLSPTVNDLTSNYTGGAWGQPAGDGAIVLTDKIQTATGVATAIVNGAVAGTGIYYDAGAGKWDSLTAGQPLPLFKTMLTAVGGDCEFIICQCGEADSEGSVTKAQFRGALDTLQSRIYTHVNRTALQLPFFMPTLGLITDGFASDATTSIVRDAQQEWARDTSGAYPGACCVDMVRVDAFHWDGASYQRVAKRHAQGVLHRMGLSSYDARGPVVVSATRAMGSTDVLLTVDHRGGSSLAETDGTTDGGSLTGFQVSVDDFSNNLTISSTAYVSATVIRLRLSAAPAGAATVKVRYLYGREPTITNLTYDNTTPQSDTIGLPLRPFQPIIATHPDSLGNIASTALHELYE